MYLTRSHSLCGCVCFESLIWDVGKSFSDGLTYEILEIPDDGVVFIFMRELNEEYMPSPAVSGTKKLVSWIPVGISHIHGFSDDNIVTYGFPEPPPPGHMHKHKKTKNGFHGFPDPPPPGHIHRHKKTKNEIWPVLSWLRAVFLSSVRKMDITMSSSWSAQNSFTRTPARFFISSTRLKFANFERMNSVKYLTNTTFVALMKNGVTRSFDC